MGFSETLGNVDLSRDYNSLSSQTKEAIEIEVRKLIEDGRNRVTKLLTERRKELDLLATALVEYESLNAEEMEKVVRGEPLEGKMKILPDAIIKLPDITIPGMEPTGEVGHGSVTTNTKEEEAK